MSIDPYKSGMLKKSPYVTKKEVRASVVAVLDFSAEERGLQLIPQPSRAVVKGHVHELILTDEESAGPDQKVDKASYLAFITIENSGVMIQNDYVYLKNEKIGVVAGFDETHMPNHQNIVIKGEKRFTGFEKKIAVGDHFQFVMASSAQHKNK